MGRAKEEWMLRQELEPMYDWIADNYGDDAGEEGSEEWEAAVHAYKDHCEQMRLLQLEQDAQDELEWFIYSQSAIVAFHTQIASVRELLHVSVSAETGFSLLVMLYGHTVAAIEAYLASTFIQRVTNSEELIRKLVESDPKFSEMKFTLKEIYEKHEALRFTVAKYLKDLIFHDIKKVGPMFRDVLDCDFGDVSWLFRAVAVRHHCVHRAGHDKDGKKIDISDYLISELVDNASQLVNMIDKRLTEIDCSGNPEF